MSVTETQSATLPAAVAVLAGGRSRRMNGVDKALLQLAGRPLLQHVLDRLDSRLRMRLLSVDRPRPELERFGLPQVPDPMPGHAGPLVGLLGVLRRLETVDGPEWLLLVPCDTPFLPVELAERLLRQATDSGKPGAVIRHRGALQPATAIWSRRLLPRLERAVNEEGLAGFKQFLAIEPLAELAWPGTDAAALFDPFWNVNSPADLDQARRWLQRPDGGGRCSA